MREHSRGAVVLDPDVINFAGVMATIVGSIASLSGIYVACKWAISFTKRREHPALPYNDARLEQLQQSVDSIAIEVERIAEAQRFSAKLLAAREAEPRLPR
jgi:hypothetical protein